MISACMMIQILHQVKSIHLKSIKSSSSKCPYGCQNKPRENLETIIEVQVNIFQGKTNRFEGDCK